MADDSGNAKDGRRRRMVNRRAAGSGLSFSGNGMSQSTVGEGVGAISGDSELDEELNEHIVERATSSPARLEEPVAPTMPLQDESLNSVSNSEEYNPAARLAQVASRSNDYAKEYRLQLLHRLLMRNLPLDEIAANLGISVRQVQRDKQELMQRLRETSKSLDIDGLIGNSKGFYEEVQAMAMRAASSNTVPMPMRLAAMRTALASHNDMHRFFQAAGVYDVLRFRKGAGEGAQNDIQRLMSLTENLLSEARSSGASLGEFSGGDSEVLEI